MKCIEKIKKIKEKLKIKLFAPATICTRQLGKYQSQLRYVAWLPVGFVFGKQPKDKDGYYKTIYINNKKVKSWYLIPRNAFIEVRQQPKDPITLILGAVLAAVTVASGLSVPWLIIGVAALIVGMSFATKKKSTPTSTGVDKPTYSASNSPSLTGAKNELASGIVPVSFGKVLQVFTYAQFCTPLVRSGYGGNRYRVYSIPGYSNARYSDFRLGDVLLSDYRAASYSLQQFNGGSQFIGWDNASTESFNKELTFDQSQAVFQSAIAYYNAITSGTTLSITQNYTFEGVDLNSWTNKIMGVTATFVSGGADVNLSTQITILKTDLVVGSNAGEYTASKTFTINLGSYVISEYRYTTTAPNGSTRGNSGESNLDIYLSMESITIGSNTFNDDVNQGVNSYNGDRNEIVSQSLHSTKYCDIHFNFPQGLYSINSSSGSRIRVTIQAEVLWKPKEATEWLNLDNSQIANIYTRDIDGVIQPLSSRIGRNGNVFTFRTPDDINNADDSFYECVGLEFAEPGEYQVKILPIVFTKDDYWVGTINIAEVVWRLVNTIPVVNNSILPNVSQIACTFNATTQLDGEVDELGAIVFPYITNIATGELEQSRNPVDIIYYLLTDEKSNPNPMQPSQIDMPSFLKARTWCDEHNCLCDGVVSDEIKYENIINDICDNNQLFFIPNKWGKAVLRVDTNEDGRPIKSFFNAENSWDLSITRLRGKINRLLAIRCSYTDEETWSEQEITGYWYNNTCNFEPESGKDDNYYQPEKRELNYIVNADNVKRRIAYELEIANVKNTTATFSVAREVLDLEILDRVLVADYTRMKDGVSGTIIDILYSEDKTQIIGVKTNIPFKVEDGMTMTVRSVDTSGEGFNVNVYSLQPNELEETKILFANPISKEESILRTPGFYDIEGTEIYYSGDLYMAGTAEILNMVISKIEEVKGDDFTSKITCRTY